MNLKTVVKVGNVSNLSDARYCAGFGVNMIGFNVDIEDQEHISVDTVKEIMGWVAGTEFILEYGSMSIDKIEDIRNELDIDNYQVDDIDVANGLAQLGKTVCFKYVVHDQEDLDELKATIDSLSSEVTYIIIESHINELADAINNIVNDIDNSIKILKSYAVDQSTVLDDISENQLADILEVLEVD